MKETMNLSNQYKVLDRSCRKPGLLIVKLKIPRWGPEEKSQAGYSGVVHGWSPEAEAMVLEAPLGHYHVGLVWCLAPSVQPPRQVYCPQVHPVRVTCVSYSIIPWYRQFLQLLSAPTLWHILSVNLFSLKSARSNLLVFKKESAWRILHSALWVCKSGILILSVLICQPHVNAKCQVIAPTNHRCFLVNATKILDHEHMFLY